MARYSEMPALLTRMSIATELLDSRIADGVHAGRRGQVAHDGFGPPAGGADVLDGGLRGLRVTVVDRR